MLEDEMTYVAIAILLFFFVDYLFWGGAVFHWTMGILFISSQWLASWVS